MIEGGNWWRANEIVMRHLTILPADSRRATVAVTKPVAVLGERRVPPLLENLQHSLPQQYLGRTQGGRHREPRAKLLGARSHSVRASVGQRQSADAALGRGLA